MNISPIISVKDMITHWEKKKNNNLNEKKSTYSYKDYRRLYVVTTNKNSKERETVNSNDLDNIIKDTKQNLIKCIYKLYNININPDERFKRIEGFIRICKFMQTLLNDDPTFDTSNFSYYEMEVISEIKEVISQNTQLPWKKTVTQIDDIIENIQPKIILNDNQVNLDKPISGEEDDVYLVSIRDNTLLNKIEIFRRKVDNIKEEIQKYRSLKFSTEHWLQMLLRMSKELKQFSRENDRDERETNRLLMEIEDQIRELKSIFSLQ